ncbi:hypothetical protein L873DRAFT_1807766 [Choiromyces venosus 120613-1]|uniref:Uncharacterized protein n=1 Tax=Choiromyces venosus 120613-1 TaxID=1336337 RepID=A0A3N4JN65_9PEZI|nr:hypothetical protein L873DRAFT_1807766 [Choiromyces venosus 120613-1]
MSYLYLIYYDYPNVVQTPTVPVGKGPPSLQDRKQREGGPERIKLKAKTCTETR